MKLSEAMRQGITQTKPARVAMWYLRNGELYTCAIGAAVYAQYGSYAPGEINPYKWAPEQWPELLQPFDEYPKLIGWIMETNDNGLTREQIADELEKAGY